jgi:hypothetical protein
MVSAHSRRVPAAIVAVLAPLAFAACDTSAASHPSATTVPRVPLDLAIPSSAVPWAPVPIQMYQPTPLPVPTATPAPRCSLDDLTALPVSTGGATGNEAVFFAFTNRTSHACLTGGYPRVVVDQPREQSIVATQGGFWDEKTPALDLAPGATARFAVGFSRSCETTPAPPLYEHVTVTLPGGGSFTSDLSGANPPDSQIPLGVFVQCGVTVTELSGNPTQTAYPQDPLLGLTASMKAPASVRVGGVFRYVIILANPTSQSIALDPCRGYYQTVDSMKSSFFVYELNCGAAHPIPAYGSESFVMDMTAAGLVAGLHTLSWNLDTDGTPGPEASATFSAVS